MTIEQRFIACDGKEFKTEEECVKYETFNKIKDIVPTLKKVQGICNKQKYCQKCVFYNSSIEDCIFTGGVPAWWNLESIGD